MANIKSDIDVSWHLIPNGCHEFNFTCQHQKYQLAKCIIIIIIIIINVHI